MDYIHVKKHYKTSDTCIFVLYLTLLLNDPCTESPSFEASLDLCLASIFAFLMALFFSRELSWADELIAAISAATTSAALCKDITSGFS